MKKIITLILIVVVAILAYKFWSAKNNVVEVPNNPVTSETTGNTQTAEEKANFQPRKCYQKHFEVRGASEKFLGRIK